MVTARTRARRIIRLYAPVPRVRDGASAYIAAALVALTTGDAAGTSVATMSVQNTDDASFAWSLIDDGGGMFQINATTGAVTLAQDAVGGSYSITVLAVGNPSGDELTRSVTITILGGGSTIFMPMMLAMGEL